MMKKSVFLPLYISDSEYEDTCDMFVNKKIT